jgi:hypothetical protein
METVRSNFLQGHDGLRVFEETGEEVTVEWNKLHIGELHNLQSSPYLIRVIR